MKHNIAVLGASDLIGCIILSESFRDIAGGIIVVERTRPAEPRDLDEIILQRVRMGPPNLFHHIEVLFIAKPTKKVWPQDHLVQNKRYRKGCVKQGIRRYLRRPF